MRLDIKKRHSSDVVPGTGFERKEQETMFTTGLGNLRKRVDAKI